MALWAAPPLHRKLLQYPGDLNSRLNENTLPPGCRGCVVIGEKLKDQPKLGETACLGQDRKCAAAPWVLLLKLPLNNAAVQ